MIDWLFIIILVVVSFVSYVAGGVSVYMGMKDRGDD